VYVSAWLKHYYPAAFTAALINSQPMGFYAVSQLVQDAQKHGVEVQAVDVNYSHWDCTLERGALRLGLRLIVGLAHQAALAIEQSRPQRGFQSYADFCQRTHLAQPQIIKLADADAFRSLEPSRRAALWQALAPASDASHLLFDLCADNQDASSQLPELSMQAEVHADYRTTSLSLRPHPLSFHREALRQMGITTARDLATAENGVQVTVAGLILLRQRPGTAKGVTFVLLEDETGTVNLVLHQTIWQKFRQVTRHSSGWIAHGRLECKDTVIHLVVQRLEDLKSKLSTPQIKSRDFR
jgi:error-prone DNA polymerase